MDVDPQVASVGDWLDAFDPASYALPTALWKEERLKRLHGYQIAQDVIAHVHNIPLRLLRIESLVRLDSTFVRFIKSWEQHVLTLLTEVYPDHSPRAPRPLAVDAARELIEQFKQPEHLYTVREWVLQLAATEDPESEELLRGPPSLPSGYAEWLLVLLPYLEREVWITDTSNPLPAHNLARMVEHWSLYLLMWSWSRAEDLKSAVEGEGRSSGLEAATTPLFVRAFGLEHLGIIAMPAFTRRGREGDRLAVLVAGPFLLGHSAASDGTDWFTQPLQRFLQRVGRVQGVDDWDVVQETAPGRTELSDALGSWAGIDADEAHRRAIRCQGTVRHLLGARLDPSVTRWPDGREGRPISRANWETMAVLSAWFDQQGRCETAAPSQATPIAQRISIHRHRIQLLVTGTLQQPQLLFYAYERPELQTVDWARATTPPVASGALGSALLAEGTSTYFARMRERQQAAWTAHVAAISHLLARHSRRNRPEGADDPNARRLVPVTCDEADHLLRGFGGRVCRYLLSMAPAELAVIYWVDYGSNPPRLRHVGGAEHLIQHRTQRQNVFAAFDGQIWTPAAQDLDPVLRPGVDLGRNSAFQVYRAVASGQIEPSAEERKAQAEWTSRQHAQLATFGTSSPLDGVSVPLLFNDRVVGVFSLAGISGPRIFDSRLYPPLRLVAQVLAQAMYFHSQVWQMRQINWLASHVPLEEWRHHSSRNDFNPLLKVARCLANIFLCPGVQIWLKDKANETRYLLHGSTLPKTIGAEHAPRLRIDSNAPKTPPLSRSFLAFAFDQWKRENSSHLDSSSTNHAVAAEIRPNLGQFVQARFEYAGRGTTQYSLEAAERGDLELYQDFVEATTPPETTRGDEPPGLRQTIFLELGFAETMAFPLVRGAGADAKVVGVVGLYAAGWRGRVEQPPWPPGWRPVVAHVQTYLPYVLMQTETIANPLDDLRRYLLHEGRNELNAASVQAAEIKQLIRRLLAQDPPHGVLRPWLRRMLLQQRQSSLRTGEALSDLVHLEQMLGEIAEKVDDLMAGDRSENMATLARLIEHQRDIGSLGLDFNSGQRLHSMQWIPLHSSIADRFSAYRATLRARGIYLSLDDIHTSIEINSQPRLWAWLLGDLAHNISKYAAGNSGVQVVLLSPQIKERGGPYELRLTNESSFDPDADMPERLLMHGVQGSAGLQYRITASRRSTDRGTGAGIGLWGVNLLAGVLGMTFAIRIVPMQTPDTARYHFSLFIPPKLLRRT